MPEAEPQAILTPITEAAIFLVLTVDDGFEDEVHGVLEDVSGLRRSVGFRVPDAALTCVVGICSDLWNRLFGAPRAAGPHRLPEFAGAVHSAVSTPGDLLFHIRASRLDTCFELAERLMGRLSGGAQAVNAVHGFTSCDERDLLGLVNGTENPEGAAARAAVVTGDDDPGVAGGSYSVVQKCLHDLAAWDALPVEAQERIIGREKLSDIERADDVKPADSTSRSSRSWTTTARSVRSCATTCRSVVSAPRSSVPTSSTTPANRTSSSRC